MINACTQTTMRFFYSKMRNFTVLPKRSFVFFYSKIPNFTAAPKQLSDFFTAKYNTIYNWVQYKIQFWKPYSNSYLLSSEVELFACCSLLVSFCPLLVSFPRCSLVFFRCALIFARCSFNALLVASMHWGINLPLKKTPPPFRQALPLNL